MDETVEYVCPHCGETIVLGIDPSGGDEQAFVEDCPVCCRPNDLRVTFDRRGEASVEAGGTE